METMLELLEIGWLANDGAPKGLERTSRKAEFPPL
jgi:hypothetical protein